MFKRAEPLLMSQPISSKPSIPDCSWQWPIGQAWETPYIVRYASNLDDGPEHGAPLGGFGAGCIGRSPNGSFNLWHLDGGEHIFDSFPGCQFSVFEQADGETRAYAMSTDRPENKLFKLAVVPAPKIQAPITPCIRVAGTPTRMFSRPISPASN